MGIIDLLFILANVLAHYRLFLALNSLILFVLWLDMVHLTIFLRFGEVDNLSVSILFIHAMYVFLGLHYSNLHTLSHIRINMLYSWTEMTSSNQIL